MTKDNVSGLFVWGRCSPDCQVMIYFAIDEHIKSKTFIFIQSPGHNSLTNNDGRASTGIMT